MIELFDLMRTVWRHRVVAIVTLAVVMAATTAYVFLQTPVYESTEALQLSSADPSFLAEVDTLTPLYSELLSAQYTLTIAQAELGAKPLAGIAVRTFTGSPVIEVDASGSSAGIVEISATAVVSALTSRLATQSNLGAPGVTLAVIDGPSRAAIVWPRPALSLLVAALAGIILGVAMSWLFGAPWRRTKSPAVALTQSTVDAPRTKKRGSASTVANASRPDSPPSSSTRRIR